MSLVERALKKMQSTGRKPIAASVSDTILPVGDVEAVSVASTREWQHPAVATPWSSRGQSVSLNRDALRAAGLLPPEDDEHPIAQQYRQIKRPLIANAIGRGAKPIPNGRLIMITSAMPGEGKTFTAINLALSMALEKDLDVVLVDSDAPKPHISRLLGLADRPGLLDVLREANREVESVIVPTDVPRLSVLPAGSRSSEATELLASAHMEKVATALGNANANRIVIFDSPPALLTTEAQALTHVVGQALLVVRAGVTPQKSVLEAAKTLGNRPSLSVVLNQSVSEAATSYYNSGYGYGAKGEPT